MSGRRGESHGRNGALAVVPLERRHLRTVMRIDAQVSFRLQKGNTRLDLPHRGRDPRVLDVPAVGRGEAIEEGSESGRTEQHERPRPSVGETVTQREE